MARIVLFNKPYGVVSQFTPEGRWRGLRELLPLHGLRVAGRLDGDSEGLLVLTDEGGWQHRIAEPRHKLPKTYWAQVEGVPTPEALARLAAGVTLSDGATLPCEVATIAEPAGLWPRNPPIRVRRAIPDCWLRIVLREGRNRQVRRMCAAIGHPVLRLIRYAVGSASLDGIPPGEWVESTPAALGIGADPGSATSSRRSVAPRQIRDRKFNSRVRTK
jgi:23S rRNA pseudouridine2457 synthase